MYWSFADLIAYISEAETLMPGDFLGSGACPTGCGLELNLWIQPGDLLELMVEATLHQFGRIDILVNSAGIFIRNSITDVSDEEWATVLGLNLMGYVYACRRVIPEMLKQGRGKIVNVSSIHGFRGTGTAATY